MSIFSEEEKAVLQNALGMYVQVVQQRMPQPEVEKIFELCQQILDKAESAGAEHGASGARPRGISDEWFKNCCGSCEKLAPDGRCMEKITEKYPGKCDPIIKYERQKASKK